MTRFLQILFICTSAAGVSFCGKSKVVEKPVSSVPATQPVEYVAVKPAPAISQSIAAGTTVEVTISDIIDSDVSDSGTFTHSYVSSDVMGKDGKLAIPAWSSATVVVLDSGKDKAASRLELALYQVSIGDKSFLLTRGVKELAVLNFTEDAAMGVGHRSVHLEKGSVLKFKVSEAVDFFH